jgi:AraC-like DNA-binding protein
LIPAICLIGFLGSILLLNFADKVNPANRYLAYHFFLNAVFGIAHWSTVISDSNTLRAIFAIHYFPIYLLNTPFLYFYVRAVLTEKIRIKGWDYLHFIPFVIVFINVLPYSTLPWQEKLKFTSLLHEDFDNIYHIYFPLLSFSVYFVLRSTLSLIYVILSGIIVLRSIKKGELTTAVTLKTWLQVCLGLGFIFNFGVVFFCFYSLAQNEFVLKMDEQGRWRNVVSIFMSSLTISIFFFPKILYGLHFLNGAKLSDVVKLNNAITPESQSRLIQIDGLMESYLLEKKFLSQGFSLTDLVRDLDVPLHALTYYFNYYKGTTFLNWKNQLRVSEAIQLMQSGKADFHTLESVGEACGYKSRSNFIQAFKANTGESPSAYLKRLGGK